MTDSILRDEQVLKKPGDRGRCQDAMARREIERGAAFVIF